MTSFWLRCIALATMVADHMGYAGYSVLPNPAWMRIAGRIAFPVYCFLLAQGFRHTRSVPKYALRLALFAVISEAPFNLLFRGGRLLLPSAHNVFFSLLFALGAMAAWKRFAPKRLPLALLCVLAACALPVWLQSDYSFWGVLLSLCFYSAGNSKPGQALALVGTLAIFTAYRMIVQGAFASTGWIWTQWYCLASLLPILLYNGKPGFRGGKWAFYALYPAHLLVLALLRRPALWQDFLSIF